MAGGLLKSASSFVISDDERVNITRLQNAMRQFRCACGNALFFENTVCLQCGSAIGYDVAENAMRPVTKLLPRCRNGIDFGACNWLVSSSGSEYCISCRLNRTIPELSVEENLKA